MFCRAGLELQHTLAHFEVTDIADVIVAELEAAGVWSVDYDEGPLKTTDRIAPIGPRPSVSWFAEPRWRISWGCAGRLTNQTTPGGAVQDGVDALRGGSRVVPRWHRALPTRN